MIRHLKRIELMRALSFVLLTSSAIAYSAAATADEPPPSSTAPQDQGGNRHHNPAFAACRKQADDQKIAPGDARKEFMRNCLKSAPAPTPTTS